jgi:signal peptidase I
MNFALIMFIALLVTGFIWLIDSLFFKSRRAKDAKIPVLTEYAQSFFPVILIVFLLRSFLVEPFQIPSGSMLPTLKIGDFILVNKFTYGIRLPILNKQIIEIGHPRHGDVMVFRYPMDPSLDYIKRVIGLPGDVVSYRNKRLSLNGVLVPEQRDGSYDYVTKHLNDVTSERYIEQLGRHTHAILIQPSMPTLFVDQVNSQFPYRQNCDYDSNGFTCKVPAGYYFMMGDNRDSSNDSRYWGFVPDSNIVGRAFMVWWNFDDLHRIGHFIE